MTTTSKYRTAFEKSHVIAPLHTGGPVAVTTDGLRIVTCLGEVAVFTRIVDGKELCRFHADNETIYSLCLSHSSSYLAIFTASLSLHIYEIPPSDSIISEVIHPIRSIHRAHDAPVHVCKIDPSSTYLASGSADGVVKVWDIIHGYITHSFKGHGGVISALAFDFSSSVNSAVQENVKMNLITASVDTYIRIFDLSPVSAKSGNSKPVAVLEGHVSVPRGLDISSDGRWLVSGGRDSVVLIWDLNTHTSKQGPRKAKDHFSASLAKTIPVLERVEALGILPSDVVLGNVSSTTPPLLFFVGGERGIITVWDAWEGKALFSISEETKHASDEDRQSRQIVHAVYIPDAMLAFSVHADQNISCHSISDRVVSRQLVGFNDEITDAVFLSLTSPDSHLALAVNSALVRVYSTVTNDCQLLPGHTDIILALHHDCSGHLLGTGSKDKTARIWAPSSDGKVWKCVSVCDGHAGSVGAIAFSRKSAGLQGRFVFTGSHDLTIKMWDLSRIPLVLTEDYIETNIRQRSLVSMKAHEKDINCLDVAPNDQMLASGSQDKTIKIYAISYSIMSNSDTRGELNLIGTCTGHKKGVWTVKFGKTERVLASGSGDKTIKIWNLNDFTCVRTLEGHSNSVLRLDFLNSDMQLASTGSDSLLKVWIIRDEECIATMDNHEDKIWALAISEDERTIVTGGADSLVTFWNDCTEEKALLAEQQRIEAVAQEQNFTNYLAMKNYSGAIQLALHLNQPGRLFDLFKEVVTPTLGSSIHEGFIDPKIDEVLRNLAPHQLSQLLRYLMTWNTKANTSVIAQVILHALLKLKSADEISSSYQTGNLLPGSRNARFGLADTLEALIPYTERHINRLDRLIQESYAIEYVLAEMDEGIFNDIGYDTQN